MKILALRVKNLASLAGEVVLDFEAPPLAQAGLFAITGPTGSGKSTLLDALCLALYDELPRLAAGGDVLSVLRHGAVDGYAEVDFVGRDGGRYRARWEVRRARNRSSGKLQKQVLALTDLASGMVTGTGKRETLRAIEDKVGLDYHQFRRSVLLAQNDFDAFLRAKPRERADLLELMTGTAIYGELSRAAFERCKAEEYSLRALEDELKRVNVFADDEREAVEAEAGQTEGRVVHLSDEVDALTRETQWYRVAAELQRSVVAAETEHEAAQTAWAAAQPERDNIAAQRRALALVPLVSEVTKLVAEGVRLEGERQTAAAVLQERDALLKRDDLQRDTARQAAEQAENAFKQAGPDLDKAADLDSRVTEAGKQLSRSQAAAGQSAVLEQQAQRNLEQLRQQQERQQQSLAALETWVAENRSHQSVAEQSERWLDVVSAYAQAAGQLAAATSVVSEAGQKQEALTASLKALDEQSSALAKRLDALTTAISDQAELVAGVDVNTLERRRDGVEALLRALAQLEELVGAMAMIRRRAADLDQRRQEAEARRSRAQAAGREAEIALAKIRAALPEAEAALALAEAAEGEQALVLRQYLRDGEPCPVCGSRLHPVEDIRNALTALLDGQRRRVGQLRQEKDHWSTRRGETLAEERSASETLLHASADAQALSAEAQVMDARWRAAVTQAVDLAQGWGIGLPALPDQLPALLDLAPERAACVDQQESAVAQLRTLRAAEVEHRRLIDEYQAAQQQASQWLGQRGEAEVARTQWEAKQQAGQADMARARTVMDQAVERLIQPLTPIADWPELLETPEILSARISALAGQWRDHSARQQKARDELQAVISKSDSAAAALDNARRNAERDRVIAADGQIALKRLGSARAELFGGQPTAKIRMALDDACKARRAAFQRAQEAWARAAQECSAAKARVVALVEALAVNTEKMAAATARRDQRLSEDGLAVAEIEVAMAAGESWLHEAEAAQAALHEAVTVARTVLDERRRHQSTHLASAQPQRAESELAELLPVRVLERDGAQALLAQIRQRLAEDDRNRGAAEETRQRIAQQRQRFDLWTKMDNLIGSADGNKFRSFAQGLTLDRLLGLANRHMSELTPRYVLGRAPDTNLGLQVVDRDMADEVRDVANLSGGERFLVSLSLALGLASMSGGRTLAESLFIDEGFGALDAESLDVAIAALETLHASGRKVGVISHVQPMIERIGVQIKVSKQGGGRSVVETKAG